MKPQEFVRQAFAVYVFYIGYVVRQLQVRHCSWLMACFVAGR